MQQQGNGRRAKQDVLQPEHLFLSAVGLRNPARWARRPRRWNRWRAGAGGPAQERARPAAGPACEQRVGAVGRAGSIPKAQVISHIPDPGAQTVRYYGWYSNASRGKRRLGGQAAAASSLMKHPLWRDRLPATDAVSARPKGESKLDRHHQASLPTKSIWLYPLTKHFRSLLRST